MQILLARLCFAWWLGAVTTADAAEKNCRLTVSAGDWERHHIVVSFALPKDARTFTALRDAAGNVRPLQVDLTGEASFIEEHLAKGATESYQLIEQAAKSDSALMKADEEGGRVKISSGGHPILTYQAQKSELPRPNIKPIFKRGGYIHPIYTPSGKVITDDYPTNHIHHHGVWWAWTKTEFEGRKPDFWNMGAGTGTVEFVALDKIWSGPIHAGFNARHRFVDLSAPEPKAVLTETWQVRAYRAGETAKPYWLFDLVSQQECATTSPLKLPEYHYGGMGFRGHGQWDGKENAFFLTAEGETDRVKGHGTRARWCHISGRVEGALTGVAILGHPDNFRAPQPMRLHPSEPFFNFAPSQLGDWEIAPGKPYVSRYRYVVQDGPPDRALLDRLWNDYAHPPQVKVEIN